MLCRKAMSHLTDAKEGALTGLAKALFDAHLTVCIPCRRYRAQYESTVDMLAKLPKEEAPSALVDLLAGEIEKKDDGA